RGIDRRDLVRPEEHDPGMTFGIELDAIGPGIFGWDFDEANLPARDFQESNRVAALRRKPDVAVLVEHLRMRVAYHRIGHRILLDAAVLRVEPADVGREV